MTKYEAIQEKLDSIDGLYTEVFELLNSSSKELTTNQQRDIWRVLYTSNTGYKMLLMNILVDELSEDRLTLQEASELFGMSEDALKYDLLLYRDFIDTLV